jgi:ligand-binding sensor domain-containing protein
MSRRQGYFVITALIVTISLVLFFNQPRQSPFPFAAVIERFPDYQPPGPGVTLYPIGGPFGIDTIEAIEVGPLGTLFVGTFGGGVYLSRDGGKKWLPSNLGLDEKFINTIFALDENRVFAATVRNGLFLSEDDGGHWKHANRGLEDLDVKTMSLRSNSDILAGTGQGVFRSQDGGRSWTPFNKGLDRFRVQNIVETKLKTLFAATQGQGVFRRKKGADSWESVVSAFSFEGLEERIIRALVLGKDDVLLAGTMSAGVFWSTDDGEHWGNGNAGLENLSIRTLSRDQSGLLYAGTGEGVYVSRNNGRSWTPFLDGMGLEERQIHSFAVDQKGMLYAGGSEEIYRGREKMAWEPLHHQLMISPILNLIYDQKEGIVAGTFGKGTYVNRNNAWMSDNMGLVNLSILRMTRGKVYLYALTHGGIYRRQRIRHRWEPIEGALPGVPTTIGVFRDNRLYLGTESGLYFSSDQGLSWEKEEALASDAIKVLNVEGVSILVATENTLWEKSIEGQWEKLMTNSESTFQELLPRPDKGLLAVTGDKIWERDLGGVWKKLGGGIPAGLAILSIAADPHNSDILYVGSDEGLFWSPDNGVNWYSAEQYKGGVFEGKINQVVPTGSSAVWLATEAHGVVLAISNAAERGTIQQLLDQF